MRPIRRILVAVKKPAGRASPAVAKAAQLAEALRAELHLFHDLDATIYLTGFEPRGASLADLERNMRAEALEQLDQVADRLRRHGVRVTTAAEWDFPVYEAVLREAQRVSADLIVAECHPAPHRATALLRYADWELLRRSPVPFLLVKSRALYRRPHLLAAIDPLHAYAKPAVLDDAILEVADRLAGSLSGRLEAVHAFVPPTLVPVTLVGGPIIDVGVARQESEAAARKTFDKAVRRYDVRPRARHVVRGAPADVIPELARRTRSAIVVMGALSRSGFKRFFIGNTAEQVIDSLECDVLVVKPAGFRSDVGRARRGPRVYAAPLVA
ncbi:MAG: universal stress protein [Steroidobacteraceae bacterium]